ncbi:MAG: CPBP family intramembrane metalloprotease [Muribaculaceae bacterium]|nr:CPBP family intramembrane metalloprotease [Muribaculaceae bacterium]
MNKLSRYSTSSLLVHFGYLFGLFFIMLVTCSFVTYFIPYLGLSPRTKAFSVAALQSIIIFILPALAYTHFFSGRAFQSLTLTKAPKWKSILGVLLIFIIGFPFLNQIIFWNETINLPESMSGLEEALRKMEDNAADATKLLLSSTSYGGLIAGILIVGILTGIAEELFFRGCMQKAFIKSGINAHVAIWITAIIFSGMHFQFFGFVPRMLLGALFGYLFWWTGSLWVSIIAHSINNIIVVVDSWLMQRNIIDIDFEHLGVERNSVSWLFCASAILLIIFFYFGRNYFFRKTNINKLNGLNRI